MASLMLAVPGQYQSLSELARWRSSFSWQPLDNADEPGSGNALDTFAAPLSWRASSVVDPRALRC